MSEIKLRAWDIKNKWMDDDFYIYSDGSPYDTAEETYDTPHVEIEKKPRFIVMQYVGVRDQNNKGKNELYQQDIVYIAGKGDCVVDICELYGTILIDEDGDITPYHEALMEMDVGGLIGNTFERDELLGKGVEK